MDPPMITSRQNPRIKAVCALKNRANREREARAVVYGVRESQRALEAGARVIECLWCRDYFRSPEAEAVVESLAAAGGESLEVARDAFDKLAYGDRQDGVVSVFETPERTLAGLELPANPLVAVLEGFEKPGNLGAVLRSADGAGVDAVVVVDPKIDLFNPNAIRASVAAVFQANVVVAAASEALQWLRENQLAIWATRPDARGMYWDVDFKQPGAIVLGGEAEGLTDAWQTAGVTPVALPMHGVADSLNVSATAAILFYEALRQRSGA